MAYLHSVIYPCLTDTGVSRIDLAIDTTEDVGTYYIDTVNPTSSMIYRGKGKQLETLYLEAESGGTILESMTKRNN